MRNKKRRMEQFSLYDHTGMAAHLEKMAAKGWLLEKIGTGGWTYRRIEPRQLRFAVTYYSEASLYDPKPTEGELTFQEYCKEAGWIMAASNAQLQIFFNEDPDAIPLETDPEVQIENIHAAGKKSFLLYDYLYLGLAILQVGVQLLSRIDDPIPLLTRMDIPVASGIWFILGILMVIDLLNYYHWRKKALRLARETGGFLPTKGTPWIQNVALLFVAAGWLMYLFSLTNTRMAVYMVLFCAALIGFSYLLNGLRQLLKKRNVSKFANQLIVILVDVVVAFALVVGGTVWIVSTGGADDSRVVDTYEFYGREREVYGDPLPLYVDELMEENRENYSCEIIQDNKGPFGWAYIGCQEYRRDRGEGPEMRYYIVEISNDSLFEICWQERLESYGGVTTLEAMKDPWDGGMVPEDPCPWQAEEVWRQYRDREAGDSRLIRWGNRLVYLTLDWEPTQGQMALIAEKLMAFRSE